MFSKSKSIQLLKKHFKKNKIATMPELFDLLGTTTRMSIFRRLSDLDYSSSYSHKGQYYTIPLITLFSSSGLRHYDTVGFSQYGNLKKTIIKLVENSMSGYTHKEFEEKLKLTVHDTLLVLIKTKQLTRQKINGCYVYFCINKACAKKQRAQRQNVGRLIQSDSKVSKILIIEVLVAIIRTKRINIDIDSIVFDLKTRKIAVTKNEIEQILLRFHLKKTPD